VRAATGKSAVGTALALLALAGAGVLGTGTARGTAATIGTARGTAATIGTARGTAATTGTARGTAATTGTARGTAATTGTARGTAATARGVAISAWATQPVVLTGQDFPGWTSGPELTARAPQPPNYYGVYNSQADLPPNLRSDCYQAAPKPDDNGSTDASHNDHNCFEGSQSPVRTVLRGVRPGSLRGYRWNGHAFVQIPFQVDTMWEHYLTNNASGFSFYSGADPMLTYTFDYQPFSETANPPLPHDCDPGPGAATSGCIPPGPQQLEQAAIACHAITRPGMTDPTPDPNPYLTDSDQLAFMARDAGAPAPAAAQLPRGIVSAYRVRLLDPTTATTRYVYVMQSAPGRRTGSWAVPIAYTAANSPYVRYVPDRDADMMAYSQSSYSDYGNAPVGPACQANGTPEGEAVIGQGFRYNAAGDVILDPKSYVRRRTLDTGTVYTPRYKFRYDGRWLMDDLGISADDGGLRRHDYGPSVIDRWKGRAFQQSPAGKTPCCGYEDEQNNWGGSSMTMGIRVGPVRVIRVTWGADSGTNVTRTDIFYADSVVHEFDLRVHPIPPLDGIYTQWDMAAGRITRYYNPYNPHGVAVEGINPVLYGDINAHIGPDGISESSNDRVGRLVAQLNGAKPVTVGNPDNQTCTSDACIYGSFNLPDATYSGLAPELLSWEEMTGPGGTVFEKWGIASDQPTSPGGAQALVEAVPYYVDDSCFDDGTGEDPGPHIALRSADEPTTWGFADVGGRPVAVAPAPALSQRYPGIVRRDGQTYDGTLSYQRRCFNHHLDGSPYNIPGTATYNPKLPAQRPDPPPDPRFGPQGDVRYLQGDIATHGLHLLFTSDSDNADQTVATDEIDSTDTQLMLGPWQPNIGAAANQDYVAPIQAVATPWPASSASVPQPYLAGSGMPDTAVSHTDSTGSSNPNAPDSLVP
jgi:hypothetical protein